MKMDRRRMLQGMAGVAGAMAVMQSPLAAAIFDPSSGVGGASQPDFMLFFQQQGKTPFDLDPVKLTNLAGNVYLLTGPGGNIAVVTGKDGVLLIDDGVPGRGKDILDGVATVSKQPVKWLINTHWHFDHTGGNEFMGQQGIEIIANQTCRDRLSKDTFIDAFQRNFAALKPVGLPKKTFAAEYSVPLGKDETLHLTHVDPAHTDGDIFIHFQNNNVLHAGDLFFNGTYPFIDYSTKGWIGGMVAAQEKILKVVDAQTKIIPGHGPMATRDELKASQDMMAAIFDRISASIKAGHSVEETVAAKPTKDFDAKWSKGFLSPDIFTTIVYKGILAHQRG